MLLKEQTSQAECVESSHGWSNFVGRLISPLARATRAPSSADGDPMNALPPSLACVCCQYKNCQEQPTHGGGQPHVITTKLGDSYTPYSPTNSLLSPLLRLLYYRVRQRNDPPPEKEGKINTSQAEAVAPKSRAVGQFLSISCEAFI